ncbi:unnamed protein product [Knipowitschia caucasica]
MLSLRQKQGDKQRERTREREREPRNLTTFTLCTVQTAKGNTCEHLQSRQSGGRRAQRPARAEKWTVNQLLNSPQSHSDTRTRSDQNSCRSTHTMYYSINASSQRHHRKSNAVFLFSLSASDQFVLSRVILKVMFGRICFERSRGSVLAHSSTFPHFSLAIFEATLQKQVKKNKRYNLVKCIKT